jgi:hypothetical protein
MRFVKTESYWTNKIAQIEKAIIGTRKAIEAATEDRQLQAQQSYLESITVELNKERAAFAEWRGR